MSKNIGSPWSGSVVPKHRDDRTFHALKLVIEHSMHSDLGVDRTWLIGEIGEFYCEVIWRR